MEPLLVRTRVGAAREAPMTWGQLTQQAIYDFTGPESHRLTQKVTVDLPSGFPRARIAAAVATVLERHESLRTLFSADRRQHVQAGAELKVPVVTAGSAEEPGLHTELYGRPFGPAELPVRFGLLERAGGSSTLLVAASHLAVDAYAANALADELRRLCGPGDAGELPDPPGRPVDRAAAEGSPAGRELSHRNVGRWQRLRDEDVASTPAPALPGLSPRFHTGTLVSPALARALPVASERLGVPPPAVVLAAMSCALGETFGLAKVATRIAFNNRSDPADRGIETLMQWGLAVVDVRAPAPAVARSAFRETMRASASARYDIYELFEALSGDRHPPDHRFLPQAFLNYIDAGDTAPAPAGRDGPSTFSSGPSHERDSDGLYFLFVTPSAEAVTLFHMFDTRLLTAADLEASARAMESWVVAAAGPGLA